MAKIKNLETLGKPARIAVIVVPALIYSIIFTLLLLVPKNRQIKAQTAAISAQEDEIARTEGMASKLNLLKQENAMLRERLQALGEQLPEEKEVSQLLAQVSDAGMRAGLQIISWKPGVRKLHPSKIVWEVPVNVAMTGSYHRLGNFFSALTSLKRIVNIADITMSGPRPNGNEAILNISFTALTFTAAEPGGLSK
ncbi:MAG: type 4a pilus biogenesis protein PilO [Nitrospiraceae bacterium]|nr:type 4a pilus biogenesis protein PilO [Nitrospiraceae bacterium]